MSTIHTKSESTQTYFNTRNQIKANFNLSIYLYVMSGEGYHYFFNSFKANIIKLNLAKDFQCNKNCIRVGFYWRTHVLGLRIHIQAVMCALVCITQTYPNGQTRYQA